MANTYTQIYIHVVFAVKQRRSLLPMSHKEELFKYLTGIVKNRGQKLIAVNGVADHIHIFLGIKPNIALSDLVRDIKAGTSGYINEQGWISGKFNWQEGFGAFSHSHSEIGRIVAYIERQEEHHRRSSFRNEYVSALKENDINYDEKYIFENIEGDIPTDL